MSALTRWLKGGGRKGDGKGNVYIAPENNGGTPDGIPVPGSRQVVQLAGQPPVGQHGDWGASPRIWGPVGYGD
jgi:hypothetical protein